MIYIVETSGVFSVADSRFEIELLESESAWQWVALEMERDNAIAIVNRLNESSKSPDETMLHGVVLEYWDSIVTWRTSQDGGVL